MRGRMALVGAALYSSWPFVAFYSDTLQLFGDFDVGMRRLIWLCALAFLLVGFGVLMWRGARADRWYLEPRRVVSVSAAFVVGNALMLSAGVVAQVDATAALAVGCTGGAIAGFSSAFFEIGWKYILWTFDEPRAETSIAVASCLSKLVAFSAMVVYGTALSFVVLALIVLVAPALMTACALVGGRKEPVEAGRAAPGDADGAASGSRGRGRLLGMGTTVLLFWFCYCMVENGAAPMRMATSPVLLAAMVCGVVVSLATALAFSYFSRSVSYASVLRFAVPLLAAGLFLAGVGSEGTLMLAYVFVSGVQLVVSILLWSSGITHLRACGGSFSGIQAMMRIFLYVGVILSSLAWPTVRLVDPLVCFFALAVVLLVVALLVLSGGWRGAEGLPASDAVRTTRQAADDPAPADGVFDAMARRHGLTPREAEIFALFASGRDSAYIRDKLYISKNTVGSHLKHIYRKLDVHSKQELIDAVEAWSEKDGRRTG